MSIKITSNTCDICQTIVIECIELLCSPSYLRRSSVIFLLLNIAINGLICHLCTRSVNTKIILRWKLCIIEMNPKHCSGIPPKDLQHTLDLTSFRWTSVFEEACGASYRTGRRTTRPMTSPHCLLSPAAGDQDLRLLYVKMSCLFKYAAKDYEACSHHLVTKECNLQQIIYHFIVPFSSWVHLDFEMNANHCWNE